MLFFHKYNQNFPCCNLWLLPLTFFGVHIHSVPLRSWRPHQDTPLALFFMSHVLQHSGHLSDDAPHDSLCFDVSLLLWDPNWTCYSKYNLKSAGQIVITSLNILLIFLPPGSTYCSSFCKRSSVCIHLYKSTQTTHVQLVAYQDPRSFFARLLSSHSAGMVHEVVLFQVMYLTFLHLFSFIRFLLDHISSLLRFLSIAELYFIRPKILLCTVSSAGLVRKYVPSYRHKSWWGC